MRAVNKAQEILLNCFNQFQKFGIKSLTMDDLARNQGISKKTLYKYFKDKNDIVVQGINLFINSDVEKMDRCCHEVDNAIEENYEISRLVLEQLKDIHPSLWYDLEKYHPQAMSIMNTHMRETVFNHVCDNLKRGIEEGHYRSNIEIPIIAGVYVERFRDMFQSNFYKVSDYSFTEIYEQIFRYHIRGIASEKGRAVLKEKLKRENLKSDDF